MFAIKQDGYIGNNLIKIYVERLACKHCQLKKISIQKAL